MAEYKVMCRHDMHRVAEERTSQASRSGGGNYRRPPRQYHSTICLDCIDRLLGRISWGHHSVERWSITSLQYAKERIEKRLGVT